MQKYSRLKRELKQLTESPTHGISCWAIEEKIDQLEASLIGQDDTPYAGGIFKLSISVPERYPFEPPQVRFITPIYHPNIDTAGRICLDILKMPPKGAWKPAHNISTLLQSIQLLLADPNPDDPLMAEISTEYKCNPQMFNQKARQWTVKYATKDADVSVKDNNNESSSKRKGEAYEKAPLQKKNRWE